MNGYSDATPPTPAGHLQLECGEVTVTEGWPGPGPGASSADPTDEEAWTALDSARALVVGDPGRASAIITPPCPSHPVAEPDSAADWFGWRGHAVRAAKVRGWVHRYHGSPCQDSYAVCAPDENRLLLAVADGVGSYARSEVMSGLATRTVLTELARSTCSIETVAMEQALAEVNRVLTERAAELLAEDALSAGASANSDERPGMSARPATTLIVASIQPRGQGGHWLTVGQVGDSDAWVLDPNNGWSAFATLADEPIVANAAQALPGDNRQALITQSVLPPGYALFLMTDGVGSAMGSGTSPVALALRAAWAVAPTVADLLAQVGFSRKGFQDDRAVVGFWS